MSLLAFQPLQALPLARPRALRRRQSPRAIFGISKKSAPVALRPSQPSQPSPAAVRALVAQFLVHELDRRRPVPKPRESSWHGIFRWLRSPWVARVVVICAIAAIATPVVMLS